MANINIRIDDNLKKDSERLFNDLGLNMTTAIILFLKQCVLCQGIPFEIKRPAESADSLELNVKTC